VAEKATAKTARGTKPAPLIRALDQSELVKEKVEQAAEELSEVNAALKADIDTGMPLVQVEAALDRSEAVEAKVTQAAEELVEVNNALAEEIDERNALEQRVHTTHSELTKSRAEERRSRHRAMHDPVTGLPNLTLFTELLQQGIQQAERHRWQLAVMFLDLDKFKAVNDAHGHAVGDAVLRTVGERLQAAGRGGDSVGRRSGDEFLFLMLEVPSAAAAMTFAQMLGRRVSDEMRIEGVSVSTHASIGVALYPEDGKTADELLRRADRAMYGAKQWKMGPARHAAPVDPRHHVIR
jgi:diguanylate cyclase (GGDEF)-like protein